jgi:hypothetical protein
MRPKWFVPIVVVVVAAVFVASSWASPTFGTYAGTTSEHGTVSFTVGAGGKAVSGFTTQDGYNGGCHFHGGVGGIPNFTVTVPNMTLGTNGQFTSTVKEKLGPFSGTFHVTGKVEGGKATGTVDELGSTCGTGSPIPTHSAYLETFAASAHA